MILQITIGAIFGIGLFLILADRLRIPYFATSKAINNLAKRNDVKTSTIDIWLKDFAIWLSKHIRLNEYRKMQLEADLQSAGIALSPEMHIADSLVRAFLVGLFAIPIFFIFPILSPVVILLAVLIYFKASKGVMDKIKAKRKNIDYEMPRFISNIEQMLKHSRDVLSILEKYKESAGTDLRYELEITIADMRSGDHKVALTRLSARVGSSMLHEVVQGLLAVIDGNDSESYWTSLSTKFAETQRQMLRAEANKIPGKVKKLSMAMLFCFMLIYVVVILMEIVTSMSVMFG